MPLSDPLHPVFGSTLHTLNPREQMPSYTKPDPDSRWPGGCHPTSGTPLENEANDAAVEWRAEWRAATAKAYARAESAANVVKLAREWAVYIGTIAEGSNDYCRAANQLADAVDHYEKLLEAE